MEYHKAPAAAGVLLSLALLGGCAAPQSSALLAGWDQRSGTESGLARPLQSSAKLEATPFFAQEDYQCGPAALATVLVSAGAAVTPEMLVPQVYLPERQGSLQAEMLAATRRQGMLAYVLQPRLEDVLLEIAAGRPVVVLQNLSLPIWPRWHYAVAMGYDRAREEILLRSGTTREMRMSLSTFEHTWARSHYWAMLALPPGALPATADEAAYVSASAALERVSPAAARLSYAAALKRWPTNAIALLGMGNAAYATRDLNAAESAYRDAAATHPESADAWNNLAQVLYERGRREEARSAGERAVALGGPRVEVYRSTLAAINAAGG
jgi:tetratricopeptide (TPR) repeat protein